MNFTHEVGDCAAKRTRLQTVNLSRPVDQMTCRCECSLPGSILPAAKARLSRPSPSSRRLFGALRSVMSVMDATHATFPSRRGQACRRRAANVGPLAENGSSSSYSAGTPPRNSLDVRTNCGEGIRAMIRDGLILPGLRPSISAKAAIHKFITQVASGASTSPA